MRRDEHQPASHPDHPTGGAGGGGGGGARPGITILGVGQMGLVCAGMLTDRDRVPALSSARPAHGGRALPAVTMWGHDAEQVGSLAQTRWTDRLPGFTLPAEVRVAIRDREALERAEVIVVAVPVQFIRETMTRLRAHVPRRAGIISVSKGIENGTLMRPLQVIADVLQDDPDAPGRPMAVLSGPTIAGELARCLPATMVAASDQPAFATQVQELFATRWMRIYTSSDVMGVEIAGAVKNVIAIAAGMLDGLQAGNNAKSALLARGLAEIARLGAALGANRETFFGIAGAGDLATSCFSPEGRNRSCGEALGRGAKLDDYLARSRHVVEGVATTKSVMDLAARLKVELPITSAVHAVLFEGLDPVDAIAGLMTREPKAERVG
ncbi:MAG: NAD(P)-dependent glycerol-3-phosphate dehydrogenase [Phycisphaerales bacterium]|jgi:glycerol-3-phosphate dehydrogenase (NAD(P)+)|nr:NAD(P)-dependent glycerol-3-phosphate dehydrogenase [Phycisphaerales bacterium]